MSASLDLSARRKLLILLICCVSLFMNYLDSTILNVALPVLQRTFHADEAALQWIVDSFLLALTCLLVLAGSIADRIGRRKVLVVGLCIFTVGSFGCSISHSVAQLVAARIVTGIGGSMLVPTTLSIIRNTFTGRGELAKAIGVWSGVYGLACACGPLIGGLLIDSVGWRSIFYVNIPVGIVGLILALRFVPDSVAERLRQIDIYGQIFIFLILGILLFTLIDAPGKGWTTRSTVIGFVLCAALVATFLVVESHTFEPLFELQFFKNPAFTGANLIALISFILMTGFLFLNTIYLQQVRGLSAFHAGLFTLPLMIAIAVCAPISGRYLSIHGPRRVMSYSSFFGVGAYAMLLFTTRTTSSLYLCVSYMLLGIALGTVNPTLTHTSVASMPPQQGGVASAITSTSRQIGSALGVAVLGSLVVTSLTTTLRSARYPIDTSSAVRASIVHAGVGALSSSYGGATHSIRLVVEDSYTHALDIAWWIGLGLCVVWFGVALSATTTKALATSRSTGSTQN
jgi:EmrB/QacA subfamily drug resistance transporter